MPTTEPVTARSIRTTAEQLVICLVDHVVRLPWVACSPKLASASWQDRKIAELSPGGYGVHWPLIDEDITIAGLIHRFHETPER